jgi:hypothetical protein
MKNLATCKPSEFVAQTAKIKNAVANWMDVIDFMQIRATQPQYEVLPLDATPEQRVEIVRKNAEIQKKQTMKNLNKILDNMLMEHPQETLEVLALCCFVEPEHVDDYTIDEYFECIMQMMQNKSVMDFFSFLAQIQTQQKSI